ncbi:MAG TPA: hypothetical protein VN731_09300 [Rhodanobacter sp.]|nr:hypothetical protein [Rhodanobacter sp.]
MSIVLHIERLVIDEALLGGERAAAVPAAIERELGRLLVAPGAAVALRGIGSIASIASLPPASLPLCRHPKDQLGTRIATAVNQALGVGGTPSGQSHLQRRQSWQSQK